MMNHEETHAAEAARGRRRDADDREEDKPKAERGRQKRETKSPRPRTHRSFSSFLVRLAPALRARRAVRLGAFVRLHRRQRRAPRSHERLVRVVFKDVFENVLRVREASVVGLGRAVGGRRRRRGGARSAVAGCPGRDARAGGGVAETAVRRENRGDASRVTHRRRDGRGSRRVGARKRRGVLRVRARRCGGGEREGAHFGGFGARSRPDPRREAHQATPRGGRAGTRRTTEPRPRVPSSRCARAEVRRATSSRRPAQMQQANRVARGSALTKPTRVGRANDFQEIRRSCTSRRTRIPHRATTRAYASTRGARESVRRRECV